MSIQTRHLIQIFYAPATAAAMKSQYRSVRRYRKKSKLKSLALEILLAAESNLIAMQCLGSQIKIIEKAVNKCTLLFKHINFFFVFKLVLDLFQKGRKVGNIYNTEK